MLLPAAGSPSRWVVRVDPANGREVPGPVHASELLVSAHRDRNAAELALHVAGSRLVELTGSEWLTLEAARAYRGAVRRAASVVGRLGGGLRLEHATLRALGVDASDSTFALRPPAPLTDEQAEQRLAALRKQAVAALGACGRPPRLCLLLTGATGFLGKEVLVQAAHDPHVAEVVCVVRPQKQGRTRVSAARRGAALLRTLGLEELARPRIRFLPGDVERPRLGLRPRDVASLGRRVTHVVHCAASVAFDDTYEHSWRANVLGTRNALALSIALQRARASRFVAHLAVETSYVHGRRVHGVAVESRLEFPRAFYNNYYELTKAMATLETERAMLVAGLRVVELLPSIVVGDARTGNNRGDTKVVNAPINAFGRIKETVDAMRAGPWPARLKAPLLAAVASAFPTDPSAEINVVPVDRVAAGVIAALTAPEAVGRRVHLATDQRIRSRDLARIVEEELGVRVHMVDPTVTRTIALPLACTLLCGLGEQKLASALGRLGGIFGSYGEWGQPVHAVGNDVKLLALPRLRPDTKQVVRMVCRHNRWVQRFGLVRDPDEIARRERVWREVLEDIEYETGREPARMTPQVFEREVSARLDLGTFEPRAGGG